MSTPAVIYEDKISGNDLLSKKLKISRIGTVPEDAVKNEGTKIIHWVRHAQGFHNVAGEIDHEAYKSEEFEDAHLTEKGEAQCESLNVSCLEELTVKNAELLVVSPMRRTLATATKCFPTLVGKIPFLAHESIREQTGEHPCDRRRPITEHSVSYPHVDFSIIKDDEDPLYFKSIERESNESLALRAHDFFDWLAIRQETNIIVVTHSAFLRNTFNLVLDLDLELEDDERSGAFKNCEMKSYMITLPTFKPY